MSRELVWISMAVGIVVVVVIAMMVGWSIGLTNALPQPQGQAQPQAQGNATMISKGLIQALEGNYSSVLSLYKKALTIDPYDTLTLSNMGRILYHLRNYAGAIQSLDKALSIEPTSVYALEIILYLRVLFSIAYSIKSSSAGF